MAYKSDEDARAWRRRNVESKARYDRERNKAVTPEERYYSRNIEKVMLKAAQKRAKAKGIKCTITLSHIKIPSTCPLLGIPIFKVRGSHVVPNSPSLDRINNNKGYVPGNVWVISHRANSCKGTLSADELIRMGFRLRQKMRE